MSINYRGKNIGTDIPLVGDAKLVLEQLLEKAQPMKHDTWTKQLKAMRSQYSPVKTPAGTVDPKEFIIKLSAAMPANANIIADVGQNQIWTCNNYKFKKGGRLLTTGGMGTMGYSIPAAVGAKMADPKRPTVAICGDGAFQMSMMELATAVQHGVDIKIVIMTNQRLGMVRELQTIGYGDRQTAVFLDGSPDFIKLAKAYGIDALRVDAKGDIDKDGPIIVRASSPNGFNQNPASAEVRIGTWVEDPQGESHPQETLRITSNARVDGAANEEDAAASSEEIVTLRG